MSGHGDKVPGSVGRVASRVYSPTWYSMHLKKNPELLLKEIGGYNTLLFGEKETTVAGFYHQLYTLQLKFYRNEYVYKNLITRKILLGRHSLDTTVQIGEFGIGQSIADLVMVNGRCEVYEIKTELDNPVKLKKQLNDYRAFSPYINIVTHETLLGQYEKISREEGLGLLVLSKRNQLHTVLEPIFRPEKLNVEVMMRSLRKNEYDDVLTANYGALPSVPGIQYFRERLTLACKMEPYLFHSLMLNVLKERKLKNPDIFGKKREYAPFFYLLYALNPSGLEFEKFNIFVNQPL